MQFSNPVINFAALDITADAAADSSNIDIQGLINDGGASLGRGVQCKACQQCSVRLIDNATADYGLMVGSPSPTGSGCTASLIGAPELIYDCTAPRRPTPDASIRRRSPSFKILRDRLWAARNQPHSPMR